jgi:hypothetical protein
MCISGSRAICALVLLSAVAGCGRTKNTATRSPAQAFDQALLPAAFAEHLRQAGGGHFHATARLRAEVANPTAEGKPASPPVLTTTTDLWMDQAGNFHLTESNDQDGGREIVRVGGEIAVALRYGKMVRRPAQDAESRRYLEQALGAPWEAWELIRRQVAVESAGVSVFRLKLGERPVALPAGFPPPEGLRKWRETVLLKNLDGQATFDAAGKLPIGFACQAAFHGVRDQVAVVGEVVVTATLDGIGKVPDVVMPEAESLRLRQRTILEERALLGGLPTPIAPQAKKALP